jgi:TPP-dependent pyruvate/acetoin dehydrogenase alpha subunit
MTAEGTNVRDCVAKVQDLVSRASTGQGPVFIEISAYRWLEHCGPNYDNTIGYRSEQEFNTYKESDPLQCFEKILLDEGMITRALIKNSTSDIMAEIECAFDFAENSSFPLPSETIFDEYSNGNN